jgi:hypothetical protein
MTTSPTAACSFIAIKDGALSEYLKPIFNRPAHVSPGRWGQVTAAQFSR